MHKHFNNLTSAEAERLAMLVEEAGEVIQAVGKILRHGYENWSPDDPAKITNRMLLSNEISDLMAVVAMMECDLDPTVGDDLGNAVAKRLRYSHHQLETFDT